VFRLATQQKILQLQGPRSAVREVRFSSTGQLVGTRFASGELRVWSATNATALFSFKSAAAAHAGMSFDFSPDGLRVAVADASKGVRLFDLASGRETEPLRLGG